MKTINMHPGDYKCSPNDNLVETIVQNGKIICKFSDKYGSFYGVRLDDDGSPILITEDALKAYNFIDRTGATNEQ
jgi:hypothetical protein